MAEHWTRPPLVPREPVAPWRAAWPFRLVLLVLLAALVFGVVTAVRVLSGAESQDPGIPGPAGQSVQVPAIG